MKYRRLTTMVVWLFGVVGVMCANAQDESVNPGGIPKQATYMFLFAGYIDEYRAQLLDKLSVGDDAKMTTAVSNYESWLAAENRRSFQGVVDLCAKDIGDDPIGYIKKREQLAAKSNQRILAHFKGALNSLSKVGREVIEEFVETSIKPTIHGSTPEEPIWKSMDKEDAQREYELDCYFVANGEYPADVQAEMDQKAAEQEKEFLKKLEEEK